jgi:hypothetical protein
MYTQPTTPFQVLETVLINGKEFHPLELEENMLEAWIALQKAHDKPKHMKQRLVEFLIKGNEVCHILNKRQLRSLEKIKGKELV